MRGCVGEEARPGRNVQEDAVSSLRSSDYSTKKRETGRPLALDGHRLMGGHNNQPKVGVDDGRGVGEEMLPGYSNQ